MTTTRARGMSIVLAAALILTTACGVTVEGSPTASSEGRVEYRKQALEASDPLTQSVFDIITDIDMFWEDTAGIGKGDIRFNLGMYDSSKTSALPNCHGEPFVVAGYCNNRTGTDVLMWDRSAFETLRAAAGDVSLTLILAHEYGHALQDFAGKLVGNRFRGVQADCLAGAYLVNTEPVGSEDLTRALVLSPYATDAERMSAFMAGFAPVKDKLKHCLSYEG